MVAVLPKYNVFDIAEYIIYNENKHNRRINNIRLQKLLYFVQLFYCAETDELLFDSEMTAWQYGPAVPIIWYKYLHYGSDIIYPETNTYNININTDILDFIDEVLFECASKRNTDLINISCSHSLWKDAYINQHSNIITEYAIKKFVKEKRDRI